MRRAATNLLLRTQRHAPAGLISRVADNCFWFGRYLERAESTARQLQATSSLALDGELTMRQCWQPIVIVAGEEEAFRERYGEAAFDNGDLVQRLLVWDEQCWVSLARSINAARENARAIREVLSGDVWETVNELYLWLQDAGNATFQWHRDDFYRRVRQMTQLALGLMRSTMLHDTALDFIWLGVMLERTNQTARLLDVHHHALVRGTDEAHKATGSPSGLLPEAHQVVETAMWVTLLRACSGLEPFMKSHAGRVTPHEVASFLVTDARFPRSITYSLHAAYERFCFLRPPEDVGLPGGDTLAQLARLDAWVASLPEALPDLHGILTYIVDETARIAATMGRELLGYEPTPEPAAESQTQVQTSG